MDTEFARNEIEKIVANHWENYVDYICFKTSSAYINPSFYYLEEYPRYEEWLSNQGRDLIKKMYDIGCYGTSELIKTSISDAEECIEVKINITGKEQVIRVIEYMNKLLPINKEVYELIIYLSQISFPQTECSDFMALYFCGYDKNEQGFSRIKFYFKTFDVYESENLSDYYLKYLEKRPELICNKAYMITKALLENAKGTLRCIGLDCMKNQSYRIKYYIQGSTELDNRKLLYENWKMCSEKDELLLNNINEIEKFMGDFNNISCRFIQICDVDEEVKVNLYYQFDKKKRKIYYSLRNDLVLRDIGGIYFVIDVREKKCYDLKRLLSLNEMGKEIFKYMKKYGVFSIQGIVSYIESIIVDCKPELHLIIEKDVQNYILGMKEKGYVLEVNGGEKNE